MKLIITKKQSDYLLEALEMAINLDYPKSDPINAQYIRLIKKIHKLQREND